MLVALSQNAATNVWISEKSNENGLHTNSHTHVCGIQNAHINDGAFHLFFLFEFGLSLNPLLFSHAFVFQ